MHACDGKCLHLFAVTTIYLAVSVIKSEALERKN